MSRSVKETAQRLKEARMKADLSVDHMAKALNKSRRTVSRIEAGEITLTLPTVHTYADETGANIEHLFLGAPPLRDAIAELRAARKELREYIEMSHRILDRRLHELEVAYIKRFGDIGETYVKTDEELDQVAIKGKIYK